MLFRSPPYIFFWFYCSKKASPQRQGGLSSHSQTITINTDCLVILTSNQGCRSATASCTLKSCFDMLSMCRCLRCLHWQASHIHEMQRHAFMIVRINSKISSAGQSCYAIRHLLSSAIYFAIIILHDLFVNNYFVRLAVLIFTPGPIVEATVQLLMN